MRRISVHAEARGTVDCQSHLDAGVLNPAIQLTSVLSLWTGRNISLNVCSDVLPSKKNSLISCEIFLCFSASEENCSAATEARKDKQQKNGKPFLAKTRQELKR